MSIEIYQVDAFTDRAFGGNPAAVCLLPGPAPAAWMQAVANEMNLSETAFLYRKEEGSFGLRWFTPAVEVELCGHATLASAHVLWEAGWLDPAETARFQTLSGELTARRPDVGEGIQLDFPAKRVEPAREVPPDLLGALGIEAGFIGRSAFDYLVEVGTEEEVRGAAPDFGRLGKVPVRGVILTARSDAGPYDLSSPASSPRVPGSTKIRSPARPTARSRPIGPPSWGKRTSWRTRPPRGAACCGCVWRGSGSCWEGRR